MCRNSRLGKRWRDRNKQKESDSTRKAKYGWEPDDFDRVLESQGGGCAICSEPLFKYGSGNNVGCVDHCHKTGKTRGVLCRRCNVTLGGFQDSADLVQSALFYLRFWEIEK